MTVLCEFFLLLFIALDEVGRSYYAHLAKDEVRWRREGGLGQRRVQVLNEGTKMINVQSFKFSVTEIAVAKHLSLMPLKGSVVIVFDYFLCLFCFFGKGSIICDPCLDSGYTLTWMEPCEVVFLDKYDNISVFSFTLLKFENNKEFNN